MTYVFVTLCFLVYSESTLPYVMEARWEGVTYECPDWILRSWRRDQSLDLFHDMSVLLHGIELMR